MGTQAQVFPTLTEFSSGLNASILCCPKYGFFHPVCRKTIYTQSQDTWFYFMSLQGTGSRWWIHKASVCQVLIFIHYEQQKIGISHICNSLCSHWLCILLSACKDPVHICFTVHTLKKWLMWAGGGHSLWTGILLNLLNEHNAEVVLGVIVWFFVSSYSCFLGHGSWFLQV